MATAEKTHIKKLITHLDPDIDDVEAIRVLKEYGENRYPGISKASIAVTGGRMIFGKNLQQLEQAGILCVGIGGSKFDEHPINGNPGKSQDCAATLAAKDVGVYDKKSLRANLEYALEKNYSANTTEFEIAPLIKLAFRYLCHTGDQVQDDAMGAKIFDAAFLFLNTAEDNERLLYFERQPDGQATRSMDEYIARWLLQTFAPGLMSALPGYKERAVEERRSVSRVIVRDLGLGEDETLKFILDYARKNQIADTGRTETSFDLAALVELAQKHRCFEPQIEQVQDKIVAAVNLFMTGMWEKDKNFHINCRNDWESHLTRHEVIKGEDKEIRITSVVSSNPEIGKFCRSRHGGHASVVIKRDPATRNTQVFFEQKYKIDPRPVVASLRIAERGWHGMKDELPQDVLYSLGSDVPGAEVWYFDGFQIMNGSLTTEVPATKLSREHIEGLVLKALKNSTNAGK